MKTQDVQITIASKLYEDIVWKFVSSRVQFNSMMNFRLPESPEKLHPSYRPDIDGLRAVAVLLVIFYHLFPHWVKGGFVGVDVFFVISGFLISSIIFSSLENNTFSFAEFYARRIKRIFPALILILAASFALGWWCVMLAAEFKQLGKHIAAGAGFVSNLVFLQEVDYFDAGPESKPLLHLWSLGIEEQFYIVWPVLLWTLHKLRWNFLIVTLAIIMASFAANIMMVAQDAVAAFYSPVSRIWELLLGGMLAYFALHTPRWAARSHLLAQQLGAIPEYEKNIWLAHCQSLLGLSLLAGASLYAIPNTGFPGWWALLPAIGTYCILSAGRDAWINRVLLSNRVLVGVGLISYPLYLWHWLLLVFAQITAGKYPHVVTSSGVFLLSLLLAWMTYQFIEKPIRYQRHNRIVPALCILMLLVGGVGWYAYERDGLDFRYPESIRKLTRATGSVTSTWREGRCFLNLGQTADAFAPECIDTHTRPLLFLWGDSHASALYPGIKALQSQRVFGIAQYTASGCPALIGFVTDYRPQCHDINDAVLEHIKNIKPDVVLLHAAWLDYEDVSKLDDTVAALRAIGVPHIVLIGPVPQWHDTLPHNILAYWREQRTDPPLRMRFRLISAIADVDEHMEAVSKRLQIEYISAYHELCNAEGCLTRTAENSTDIMSFDHAHLTPQGSELLIKQIEGALLGVAEH